MKKSLLTKRIYVLLFVMIPIWQTVQGQALLVENFDYASGALLTANGWIAHSGAGTESITVNSSGLTFTGYPSSGIGLAALLDNNGEDVNKTFTAPGSGTVYIAFLLNVAGLPTSDSYFFHLSSNPLSSSFFRAKLFTVGQSSPFNIGISVGANTPTTISGGSFTTGTTYLCVIKYEIVDGTTNDAVSLFVLSGTIPSTEPGTPSVGPLTDGTMGDVNPGSVALRQFNVSQNYQIDGIRVATNWTDIISDLYPPVATFSPGNSATDVVITEIPTITFDEPVRKVDGSALENSDLAALITFKKTDVSGADVPFSATIDATKKVITITPASDLDNSQAYYLSVGPVEDIAGNESVAQSITFTTIPESLPVLNLTSPIGGEKMYAGQAAKITWTSANVANVKIEVYAPDEGTWGWDAFIPSAPAAPGEIDIVVPADARYGTQYKIRVSDFDNPALVSEGGSFTIIAVATSITDLRERCVEDDIVLLNSEVILTFKKTSYNQKYIQDANAGLLIHDFSGVLTTTLEIGDKFTGLEGRLDLYGGLLEIIPVRSTVDFISSDNAITVPEMTLTQYAANYLPYESMLIRLSDVTFSAANGTLTFSGNTNYIISDGTNEITFRTFPSAAESNIVGWVIPEAHVRLTGLAGFYNATIQILSRTTDDFEILTGIERNNDPGIIMYPVPAKHELTISNVSTPCVIEVLDATGRVVRSIYGNSDNEVRVSLSDLRSGFYFVRYSTGNGVIVKKFIKE